MDIITKSRTESERFIKLRKKSVDYFESISVKQSSVFRKIEEENERLNRNHHCTTGGLVFLKV
jgi:hypothetical protein